MLGHENQVITSEDEARSHSRASNSAVLARLLLIQTPKVAFSVEMKRTRL